MNRTLILLSLISSSVFSLFAYAEEAQLLKTEQSIEISAKAGDVWAKASNFGDLGAWHPAVKSTEIVSGENNKKGAVRLLTLQDGGTVKEQLEKYDAKKHCITYTILEGVLPVSHYKSTLSIKSLSANLTKVEWSGSFKRKDTSATPTAGQGDEDAVNTMNAVYKAGLENLKKITE